MARLKVDSIYAEDVTDKQGADAAVFEYIELFYNRVRRLQTIVTKALSGMKMNITKCVSSSLPIFRGQHQLQEMVMKNFVFYFLLVLSPYLQAGVDANESCRVQYQPIHESGTNEEIAGFLWDSLYSSDPEYAKILTAELMRDKLFALNYSDMFMRECLESDLSVRAVINSLKSLRNLEGS